MNSNKRFSIKDIANICNITEDEVLYYIKNDFLKTKKDDNGFFYAEFNELYNFMKTRNYYINKKLKDLHRDKINKINCLLIDDDRDLNKVLKKLLEVNIKTLKISEAFDGYDAIRKLYDVKPKIVIVDLDLPGINGFNICEKIITDKIFEKSQIIVISGIELPEEKAKKIEEYNIPVFKKPLIYDHIIEKVKEVCEKICSTHL